MKHSNFSSLPSPLSPKQIPVKKSFVRPPISKDSAQPFLPQRPGKFSRMSEWPLNIIGKLDCSFMSDLPTSFFSYFLYVVLYLYACVCKKQEGKIESSKCLHFESRLGEYDRSYPSRTAREESVSRVWRKRDLFFIFKSPNDLLTSGRFISKWRGRSATLVRLHSGLFILFYKILY